MPTVGVFACIFNEKNQVLCVKRNYGPKNWTTPGGRMDPCESVHNALVREVREETGYIVEPGELVGIYSMPERDDVVIAFTAKPTGREPWHPTQEISEVEFFDVNSLPSPMSDRARARIQEAARGIRGLVQTLPVAAAEAGPLEKGSLEFRRIVHRIEGSIQLFRDLMRYLPEDKIGISVGRQTISGCLAQVSRAREHCLQSLKGSTKSMRSVRDSTNAKPGSVVSLAEVEKGLELSADHFLVFLQKADAFTEHQIQALLDLLESEMRSQGLINSLLKELDVERPRSWVELFADSSQE